MPKRKASAIDASQGRTIVVDPEGDLYMTFTEGRILVSSKALCLCSRVFKAMLESGQPPMKTESEIAGDGKRAVSFDMDDFKSMTVVVNLLHHQETTVPDVVTLPELYQIAELVKKYDLKRGLGRWPHHWCKKQQTCLTLSGSEKWLRISSVFNQPDRLEDIARYLVTTSTLSPDGHLLTADGAGFREFAPPTIHGLSF